MVEVSQEDFIKKLKYGDENREYPTETTMVVQFGCPHCEGFEEHEFLGFRTNINKEEGMFLEEVWKCTCCGKVDVFRRR
ncbi:hypothetical protein [Metaclostridioides mangenotii]|uniref:hypothetical protein n=1 Tax=Metaclostridioides mangenotii TaxID=1540 RepID=UPI0004676E42|nr:hypothetical protein [Clostridioides mangenotii]